MKLALGPVEIKFGGNGKKPATSERGATGTIFLQGKLSEEEYNADLRGEKAIKCYDKMRRSDGQVKATILVCELPLLSASWSVEPASKDEKDKEVAQFIQDNLFEQMTITWDSFLKHTLLMLPFGFSIFEKVYEIVDDKVRWRKFAPRLPKTLWEWKLDKHGGLEEIIQLVYYNGKFDFIPIPAEKLLVFTHEKEGSNYQGVSILRAAYKHWYYKDHLYRIDGIASERHALGIPHLSHPADAGEAEKTKLEEIGSHLYAHEQMYVRLSNDYGFDIKGLAGNIKDLLPSIEHHDRMIARSILADFLSLGSSDVGSYALSRDKSSFFLMALRSVGKNICDTVNRYAIPQLVDYNWPDMASYPKLAVSGLETRNMGEYAKAVTDLITTGGLRVDKSLRDTLRAMLNLPPEPEEEEGIERHYFQGAEIKQRRELTYAESFVAFDEIAKVLDQGEDKFIRATKDLMDKQITNLVEVASKAITNRNLEKLEDIEVRYKQQVASKIFEVLKDMFNFGRLQVKRELQAQHHVELAELPGPLGPEEMDLILEFLKARAKASSSLMATKLKSFITHEALRQIKKGLLNKTELIDGLKGLSDKELIASAQYTVNEAFNFGRSTEAEKVKADIGRVQYSAIMDANTCASCSSLDSQEWDYNDPRTAKYASGNPDCEGRTRCRCVLIYISAEETPGTK